MGQFGGTPMTMETPMCLTNTLDDMVKNDEFHEDLGLLLNWFEESLLKQEFREAFRNFCQKQISILYFPMTKFHLSRWGQRCKLFQYHLVVAEPHGWLYRRRTCFSSVEVED